MSNSTRSQDLKDDENEQRDKEEEEDKRHNSYQRDT
jgi:hypothetical protein